MLNVTGAMLLFQKGSKGYTLGPDLVPRALPGRCNPLQPARAGALGAGGLGRSAAAWRDEGRAPGSGLSPRAHPELSLASSEAPRCGHPLHHKSAQMVFLWGRRQWAPAHSVRRPRLAGGFGVWVGGEGVPELEGIQAKWWLKAKARGGGW